MYYVPVITFNVYFYFHIAALKANTMTAFIKIVTVPYNQQPDIVLRYALYSVFGICH